MIAVIALFALGVVLWALANRWWKPVIPVDWDGQSWCVEGCGSPATHRRWVGMEDEEPISEMVCCAHAREHNHGW